MKKFQIVVAAWVWLIALNVSAQEAEAKAAFEEGKRLFAEQEYEAAAAQFSNAYNMKKTWKLLFNIAQAEAAARRYGLALAAFEKYLSQGGDEISVERRDEVLAEIRSLRDMVGDVKVQGPAGATVMVDGVIRGTLPLLGAMAVSAGVAHEIEVRDGDATLLTKRIRVRSGAEEVLVVEMDGHKTSPPGGDTASADLPTPKPKPASDATLKRVGGILVGSGAVVSLTGVLTGTLSLANHRKLEKECDGQDCYTQDSKQVQDKRDSLALVTDILIPTGLVVAATGIVILIVAKKKRSETLGRIAPMWGRQMAGVQFERSF